MTLHLLVYVKTALCYGGKERLGKYSALLRGGHPKLLVQLLCRKLTNSYTLEERDANKSYRCIYT
jgi:hypothetical protein